MTTTFDPYLVFDGNCADAMRFYEKTLGGKLEIMTHAESPMAAETPPGMASRIMHARLSIGDRMLMASDAMAGPDYKGMLGFSVCLTFPTAAEAKKVYDAFAKGGKVTMPLQKTFWVESFGMGTDLFGTPWMINGGASNMAM
jgi:PhnB protein